MKRLFLGLLVAVAVLSSARDRARVPAAQHGKYLIVLQTGKETHEGLARALHALLYARELREHGHDAVLVFDGAGTEWAEEWTNPSSQHKLAPMYRELSKQGLTNVICDFCANAFAVKQSLQERRVPLAAEYDGHPSIAKWADRGYRIIIL